MGGGPLRYLERGLSSLPSAVVGWILGEVVLSGNGLIVALAMSMTVEAVLQIISTSSARAIVQLKNRINENTWLNLSVEPLRLEQRLALFASVVAFVLLAAGYLAFLAPIDSESLSPKGGDNDHIANNILMTVVTVPLLFVLAFLLSSSIFATAKGSRIWGPVGLLSLLLFSELYRRWFYPDGGAIFSVWLWIACQVNPLPWLAVSWIGTTQGLFKPERVTMRRLIRLSFVSLSVILTIFTLVALIVGVVLNLVGVVELDISLGERIGEFITGSLAGVFLAGFITFCLIPSFVVPVWAIGRMPSERGHSAGNDMAPGSKAFGTTADSGPLSNELGLQQPLITPVPGMESAIPEEYDPVPPVRLRLCRSVPKKKNTLGFEELRFEFPDGRFLEQKYGANVQ